MGATELLEVYVGTYHLVRHSTALANYRRGISRKKQYLANAWPMNVKAGH